MVRVVIVAAAQLAHAASYLQAIPGAAERAMSRALNRSIGEARQGAMATIGARYAVKPSDLAASMSVKNATPSTLSATLTTRSGSLPLSYFPHTPTAPGTGGPGRPILTAEVLRGAQKPVLGAFVAPIGGKPRIVTRTATGSLKVLSSVPIGAMLGVASVRDAVEGHALEHLDANLDREIDRELERVK